MRHKGQINEVEVLLPLKDRAAQAYEPLLRSCSWRGTNKLYGRGSALAGAQLEIVVCRLRARALYAAAEAGRCKEIVGKIPQAALRKNTRSIYWPDLKKHRATPVFDGEKLLSGNESKGPAIVETADTTVVVHPGRTLRLDAARQLRDHLQMNAPRQRPDVACRSVSLMSLVL